MGSFYIYKTNSMATAFSVAPTLTSVNYTFSPESGIDNVVIGDKILVFKSTPANIINANFDVTSKNADGSIDLNKVFETSKGCEWAKIPNHVAQTLNASEDNSLITITESDYTAIISEIFEAQISVLGVTINKNLPIVDIDTNYEQKIYYGAPGTGKSHEINRISKKQACIRTTFHPDSDYSTFVGAYKPTMTKVELRDVTGKVIVEHGEKVTEDKITYSYVAQAFLQSYIAAWENYPTNQILIIEEINRGNCAQIFGDLFQLLDRNDHGFSDYPIQADADIKKYISDYFTEISILEKLSDHKEIVNALYAETHDDAYDKILSGELLVLPSNMSIYATMNTSDQSLFPIDSAFKRRWDWVYMPIADAKKEWILSVNGVNYDWWSFLEKINEIIFDTTNSEDKQLGYFFTKTGNDGVISADRFVGKVIFYLWNDVFKDYGFDNDIFFDNTDNKTITFQKFYNFNGSVNETTLEKFLVNLGVDNYDHSYIEDGSTKSTKDHSRYSINGEGTYKKGPLAQKLLELYIRNNSQLDPEEVVANWNNLDLGMKHFVENTEMKEARIEKSSDKLSRCYKIDCNGTPIFITNQWNTVNINKLIEAINSSDWGYQIVKLAE